MSAAYPRVEVDSVTVQIRTEDLLTICMQNTFLGGLDQRWTIARLSDQTKDDGTGSIFVDLVPVKTDKETA